MLGRGLRKVAAPARSAGLVAFVGVLVLLGLTAPAGAATAPPAGHLSSAVQNTFVHKVRISGWVYDPARMTSPVTVRVYVDTHYVGHQVANHPSPDVDKRYHLRGDHGYTLVVPWTPTAHTVTAKAIGRDGKLTLLGRLAARHYMPPPGTRIVYIAKRYVGRSPYREGGASPSGFDCSGYTMYSYAQAHVATLPHNAEQQRHVRGMRRISVRTARPGDLVFYLSGGSAYHVAIYAGHGMQYAAATPQDGLRYQHVWSSAVEYRTDWH